MGAKFWSKWHYIVFEAKRIAHKFSREPLYGTYPKKLSNGNAVDGVRLLTAEDLEQHVLHIGKVVRLNVTAKTT